MSVCVETREGGAGVKGDQVEAGEEVELKRWDLRRESFEDDTQVRLKISIIVFKASLFHLKHQCLLFVCFSKFF